MKHALSVLSCPVLSCPALSRLVSSWSGVGPVVQWWSRWCSCGPCGSGGYGGPGAGLASLGGRAGKSMPGPILQSLGGGVSVGGSERV